MIIGADGNVSPCSYYQGFGNSQPFIGNVNDTSIAEVWNGEGYQRLRSFMLSEEGKNGCSGCLAMAQELMGSPFLPSAERPCAATDNVELMMREVAERKTIIQAKPGRLSYTPSQRCNFRCSFCYQDYDHSLSLKSMRRVDGEVLELVPFLVQVIAGGGEPFVLPVWQRFLRDYSLERNPVLSFATTTNGSLVNEKLLEKLAIFPSVAINFSLDARDEALFGKLRIHSKPAEVFRNVRRCLERRGDFTNPNFLVSACMTVMKSNLAEVLPMFRLMLEWQITIGFSPLNVYPLHESVVCFNNPHRELAEMRRVRADFDRFREEELHSRPEYEEFITRAGVEGFIKHIEVLWDLIPWDLESTPHYHVRGAIPPGVEADFSHRSPLVVGFFPYDGERLDRPRYFSRLRPEGWDVWLPEGRFALGHAPANVNPSAAGNVHGEVVDYNWVVRVERADDGIMLVGYDRTPAPCHGPDLVGMVDEADNGFSQDMTGVAQPPDGPDDDRPSGEETHTTPAEDGQEHRAPVSLLVRFKRFAGIGR